MKRWAYLTILLYGLVLVMLTVPMVWLVLGLKWSESPTPGWRVINSPSDGVELLGQWGYWVWLAVMLLCEAVMLLVPVATAERRPRPRRRLWVPIATAGFLLANLAFAGVMSIACAMAGDDGFGAFEFLGKLTERGVQAAPGLGALFGAGGLGLSEDFYSGANAIAALVILWMIWAWVFHRASRADAPETAVRRLVKWLLRGSILELMVAVPSHLIVRSRDDCCAPGATFWGMATGVSVMLLAFGPGVFFLFVERMRRLQPKNAVPPRLDEV